MAKQSIQEQMLALLEKAQTSAAPAPAQRVKGRDITKALGMFKKGQELIAEAIALLSVGEGDDNQSDGYKANVAKFPLAANFFGYKSDGTPKKASGKAVGGEKDKALRKAYPELFDGSKPAPAPTPLDRAISDAKDEAKTGNDNTFTTSKGNTLNVPGRIDNAGVAPAATGAKAPAAPAPVNVVKIADQKKDEVKK